MTIAQISKYKTLLLESKELLHIQLSRKDLTESYSGDDVDVQSALLENQKEIERLNRAAIQLRKIEKALTKFKTNTFGICESCEEEIEQSRLLNTPVVELCLYCKEIEEQSAHSFGRNSKKISDKNSRFYND